jgi:hypothetical protein
MEGFFVLFCCNRTVPFPIAALLKKLLKGLTSAASIPYLHCKRSVEYSFPLWYAKEERKNSCFDTPHTSCEHNAPQTLDKRLYYFHTLSVNNESVK